MINVCIAGATGWAGRALVAGVLEADDLVLRSAVARSAAGADLGRALGGEALPETVGAQGGAAAAPAVRAEVKTAKGRPPQC